VKPIDVLCSNFVKFGQREIGEIVRYLPDKNFTCLSNCRYCADRAHNLPGPAPDSLTRSAACASIVDDADLNVAI